MKIRKNLFLLLMLFLLMTLLSGCSLIKEPTKKDVKNALVSLGYLPDESKEDKREGYSYTISIIEAKTSSSKNKADVKATLVEKFGYVKYTQTFTMNFNLKNNKETWVFDDKSLKLESEKAELVKKITPKEASKLVRNHIFTVEGKTIYADEIRSVKAGEEWTTDNEKMTSAVRYEVHAEQGKYSTDFVADMVFEYVIDKANYTGQWKVLQDTVDESSIEHKYATLYNVNIDTSALAFYIKTQSVPLYFMGVTYTSGDDDVKIQNVTDDQVEPDEKIELEIPTRFDFIVGDALSISVSAMVKFHFTKKWEPYYVYDLEITDVQGNWTGTWTGNMNDGRESVNIDFESFFNGGEPMAVVEVDSLDPDKGRYSWRAKLVEYKPLNDNYMRLDFYEWIKLPENKDEYGYCNFSGSVKDGIWSSEFEWQDFRLKKAN